MFGPVVGDPAAVDDDGFEITGSTAIRLHEPGDADGVGRAEQRAVLPPPDDGRADPGWVGDGAAQRRADRLESCRTVATASQTSHCRSIWTSVTLPNAEGRRASATGSIAIRLVTWQGASNQARSPQRIAVGIWNMPSCATIMPPDRARAVL